MNPPLCAYCPALGRGGKENVAMLNPWDDSAFNVNSQPCCRACLQSIVDLYHMDALAGWPISP